MLGRYWWRHIPLGRALMSLMIGVFSAGLFSVPYYVSLLLFLLILVCILLFFRFPSFRYGWINGILILMGFFLFGNSYASFRSTPKCPFHEVDVHVSGHVVDRIGLGMRSERYEMSADSMIFGDTLVTGLRGIVYLPSGISDSLAPGRQLTCIVRLMPMRNPDNPGMFDYSQYLDRQGYSFLAYADTASLILLSEEHRSLTVLTARLKNHLTDVFFRYGISKEKLGLLQSFFLGDKSELDSDVKNAFMNTGTMHLLAVSGMHVGIIYLLLTTVVTRLNPKRKRWVQLAIVIPGVWLYGFLAGMAPSVMRAVIMMSVIETGRVLSRNTSMLNLLVVALLLIVIINPYALYSAGLWLSFSAVGGIVFLFPLLNGLYYFQFPPLQWLWSLTLVSLSAQVGTIPFTLFYFHSFPTWFLFNNLILVPLLAPILFLAVLILVCASIPFFAFFASMFSGLLNDLLGFVEKFVVYAESLPFSLITYIPFDGFDLVATLMMVTLLFIFLQNVHPKSFVLMLLVAVVFMVKILVYNILIAPKTEMVVFNAPSKLMVAMVTPAETKLFVSENVTAVDIGYVMSGYLSQAGVRHPTVVTLSQSALVDVGGLLVMIQMKNDDWNEETDRLSTIGAVVVGADVWPPADFSGMAPESVVLSSALRGGKRNKWRERLDSTDINVADVFNSGANVLIIK